MARVRTTWAAMAALLTVMGCRGNRSNEPPVHLQQNMDFQERGEAQERNDFFADGRVMRPPVPGTIAVGYLKEDDHLWRGRLPNGALADELPAGIELSAALLDRGQERYNIYCAPCHGEAGDAQGPVAHRVAGLGVNSMVPPTFHDDRLRSIPDGQVFATITHGIRNMPAYAQSIPTDDRWAIVTYVRALQLSEQGRPSRPE